MCLRTLESSYEWEKVLFHLSCYLGAQSFTKTHVGRYLLGCLLLSLYSLIYKTSTLQI